MLVSREIQFKAFHSHKGMLSEPWHEHEFTVVLTMKGDRNEDGFVVDFRAVKRLFRKIVVAELEGCDLDKVFEFPTSENLAAWIWQKMDPFFPLFSIEVREKPHSRAIYFGPSNERELPHVREE